MKTRIERKNPDRPTPPTPASEAGARKAQEKMRKHRRPREIVAFLFLASLFLSQPAFAKGSVSMKDGSYSTVFIDIDESKSHPGMKLQRFYSSRSLHSGMFGFGWCSTFESRLMIERSTSEEPTTLVLRDCGREGDVQFERSLHRLGSVQYRAEDSFWGSLVIENSQYTLTSKDGNIRRFDSEGRLVSWQNDRGVHLSFFYDKEKRLTEVESNRNSDKPATLSSRFTLRFTYTAQSASQRHLVTRVSSSNDHSAEYHYDGVSQNLLEMKNAWGSKFSHRYDSDGNLLLTSFPDGTNEVLQYNSAQDWVTSYRGRDGCREKYQFIPKTSAQHGHISIAEKFCGGLSQAKIKMDFIYQRNLKNQLTLKQIKIERNGLQLPDVLLAGQAAN